MISTLMMTISLLLLTVLSKVTADCLPTIPLILDDVHDGDQKMIKSITWDTFVIHPYPNTSQWEIQGKFELNCAAMIDFNVSGKEDYPPVPLKMMMWIMQDVALPGMVKLGFEFTDPSETLAPRTHPLNIWISTALSDTGPSKLGDLKLPGRGREHVDNLKSETCIYTPRGQPVVYNDILVDDQKNIVVDDDELTITPYDKDENWVIESTFSDGCVAIVNFNVPGYPNPPAKPQTMSIWGMAALTGADKDGMIFANPGAEVGAPLNAWLPDNEERND